MRFKVALAALVLAGLPVTPASAAQIFESYNSNPPGLEIDPSTRSAGMAGAASAVYWGTDPNYWANPALLGYASGIRYEEATADYDIGFRARGFEPLVSLGAALDLVHTTQGTRWPADGAGVLGAGGYDEDSWGGELALANVLFARWGGGRTDFDTARHAWGLGLGLPLGSFGGFRYDHSDLDFGNGLAQVKRQGWSAWIDPGAIYRSLR